MSDTVEAVDPLWLLWHALGEPEPEGAPRDREGRCSRCGSFDPASSRIKAVVSDKFTGWEDYTQHPDPLWCTACAWGHTASEVRTRPWRIGAGRTIQPGRADLFAELSAPLDPLVALIVPASRHKHLLPAARWGVVTTDDRHLHWGHEEARLLAAVAWLRGLGFTETALAEPSPRFEVLSRTDGGTLRQVMLRWQELAGWRRDAAYLKVACLASRPDTGAAA